MNPYRCHSRILAGLVAAAGLALAAAAPAADRRPNILFILADDMGWTDGECFGSRYYETPNLAGLAAQAMRFTSGYASCAVCSPTRAAILTGKSPARLHITDWIGGETPPPAARFRLPDWQKSLPLAETTLAEALRPLGYATGHIGKWHLGGPAARPQDQGFDVNVGGGAAGRPASYFWPYGPPKHPNRVPHLAEQGGRDGEYLTDRLTEEALRFIETNRSRPFYLQLWHYTVHSPLQAPRHLVERARLRPPAGGQGNPTYAAMLASLDENIGRILRKLDEWGLSDHTIVVFTSDNGGAVHFGKPPATSNLPLRMGKGFAYEGGLRVPLLVKAPGVTRPGSVCDTPVSSTDFFPTLLELAGADRGASTTATDGVSIVPLLRGAPALPGRDLFWHYPHYWHGGKVSPYSVVRSGDWKLIRFHESGREELYDLKADLAEQHDRAPDCPDIRQQLGDRLDAWLKQVGAQMPVPVAVAPPAAPAP